MTDEITALLETAAVFESAGIDYMLTGSMALNFYATPRMTRDIDLVGAVVLRDVDRIERLFPSDRYYVSRDAVREAVLNQTSFNLIHLASMTKVDIMIRKQEEYRQLEFGRRQSVELRGHAVWVVSCEDLIISKLDWSRESRSTRQMEDVRNLLAGGCDMEYISTWARRLNLTDMLTQAME